MTGFPRSNLLSPSAMAASPCTASENRFVSTQFDPWLFSYFAFFHLGPQLSFPNDRSSHFCRPTPTVESAKSLASETSAVVMAESTFGEYESSTSLKVSGTDRVRRVFESLVTHSQKNTAFWLFSFFHLDWHCHWWIHLFETAHLYVLCRIRLRSWQEYGRDVVGVEPPAFRARVGPSFSGSSSGRVLRAFLYCKTRQRWKIADLT